jgi:hypothetical protein
MIRWTTARNAVLILLGILSLPGCKAPKPDLTVPLDYRPDTSLQPAVNLTGTQGVKLYLEVLDERPDKTRIGENVEDEPPRPIFAGPPEPAEFVRNAVAHELSGVGIIVVPERAQAGRTLTLHLIRFWCAESSVYDADVRANADVMDGGKSLWSAVVIGTKRNFGRSLSVLNYQETFSGAVLEMTQRLVSDTGFQKAVSPK